LGGDKRSVPPGQSPIPLQPKIKKAGKPDTEDGDDDRETDATKAAEVGRLVQRPERGEEGEDFSGLIGDEAVSRSAHRGPPSRREGHRRSVPARRPILADRAALVPMGPQASQIVG
jgi:hypothetical protein